MTNQKTEYRLQLKESHEVFVRAGLLDRNEQFLHWLDHDIVDGQVDVDTKSVPERKLSIVLADPLEELSFGPGNVWADNFIRVEMGIDVPSLAKRVWHPVFTGPIRSLSRDGGLVTLAADSKDSLLQDPFVWGKHIKNAANVTGGDAIIARTIQAGNSNRNEIQMVEALATVVSGSWKVKFGNDTSTPIQWDTTAGALETILLAMSSIPAGGVSCTGGPLPNKPIKVTFTGGLGNAEQELLEIKDTTDNLDDDIRYAAKMLRVLLRTTGERKYAFGNFEGKKLPKNFKIPKDASVWEVVQRIVESVTPHAKVDWRAYYDGAGVLRVDNMNHGFQFTEDYVLNQPTVDFDQTDFRNTTVVMLSSKEGQPIRPVVTTLVKRNPLSPTKLARNSKKRYIVERIENTNTHGRAQAMKIGRSRLKKLSEMKTVQFDSLPIPILVPGTRCSINIDDFHQTFRLTAFSIGLRAEDSMSIGYTRRMKTKRVKWMRSL